MTSEIISIERAIEIMRERGWDDWGILNEIDLFIPNITTEEVWIRTLEDYEDR